MSQPKVIIGGDIIKKIGAEAIKDLVTNKTMIIHQLTGDLPSEPEIVFNIKNIDEAFSHFKPSVKISFIDNRGNIIIEKVNFTSIADFSLDTISKNSEWADCVYGKQIFSRNDLSVTEYSIACMAAIH